MGQIVLAHETEFTLGGLLVCPSKREVIAGDSREVLQPRIMQVLVALARRRGNVVSHDELLAACWSSYAVSDDAIHRCIARLRRLSEAHGGFDVETVPRVGYQLTEADVAKPMIASPLQALGRAAPLVAVVLTAAALVIAAGYIAIH